MPLPPRVEESDLRDYLQVLFKHRWMIMSVFIIVVATAAIRTYLQTPIYQATARVLIDPEPPRVLNIQEVTPIGAQNQEYYRTQIALIKSRPVMEKVVENFNLTSRLPELAEVEDPVAALLPSVAVMPKRTTRLVDIKFEHPDPVLAAMVANAIAHTYARSNLDLKLKGAREALAWLSEQMNGLKAKVKDSSLALQTYRVKAGIVGLEEQRRITTGKIVNFNNAYMKVQTQRLTIEAKLKELRAIVRDPLGAQTIFTVANTPLIQRLKTEAADLKALISEKQMIYKETHPIMIRLQARVQEVQKKVVAEIQTMLQSIDTEYQVAMAREKSLLRNVNKLRREAQNLSGKEIQYQALERQVDSNKQMQETVLNRLKEMGVSRELETNNIRVMEEAQVPGFPIKPRKTRDLSLAIVIGLLGGIGLAFFREHLDNTIRTPEEVGRYLGFPVVGIIPVFEEKR
ncbi:MAG: GumC family protein [Deltaproteobacteria bacterium]|nr:GumC family protein [Deltaproteobacteria bacterium]